MSTKLRSAERSPVSFGPGEPLRSWLGRTAALCELAVVASGQPCVLAGDFNTLLAERYYGRPLDRPAGCLGSCLWTGP